MNKIAEQGLIAMERPGGLKTFTIRELWILSTDIQECGKATPAKLDRIKENIFMRISDRLDQHKNGNDPLFFTEVLQLILDFPEHLTTTNTLNQWMDEVECSLFALAFEMGATTKNFLSLLEEAQEKGQSENFCNLCKEKAESFATSAKDRSLLQKAGIQVVSV